MTSWTEAACSVWGKFDPDGGEFAPDRGEWLPLVVHLEHAQEVARLLWDRHVPGSIKAQLCADLNITDAQGRALVSWYAAIHDVGKASPAFARKAGSASVFDRMRDVGLVASRSGERVRHETVGQLALRDWLIEKGVRPRVANTWACVVGGHHGRNPRDIDILQAETHPNDTGRGLWEQVRNEILEVMAAASGPELHLESWTRQPLPVRAQTLITAIVIMADWIASNRNYFPYKDDKLSPVARARVAFDELNLPSPWAPPVPDPDPNVLFRQRFPSLGGAVRPMQAGLFNRALTCAAPPLFILEAPMGSGKTEGALLAAEVLAARFGQSGVYVGLPTMATANQMFERTLDWLSTALGSADASVTLAHGKAGLNDRYAGMLRRAWAGQVYDDDAGHAVVNSWLTGRRKAVLANFMVGTVDQGLFVGLKAKYVVLRHLGLASKVAIFDEVHAADRYMRQYLKRVLTWLGAYRVPVILMSATLPPAQRDEYLQAYAAGRGIRKALHVDPVDTYPRLTCFDGTVTDSALQADASHTVVRIERLTDDLQTLADTLSRLLAAGGCAGVLCNTVRRAQEAYQALREVFGTEAVLIHSRFIAPHRATKEKELVQQLGRDGERPHRLVVVGTQVLEQSLDIDFDVMVTDLAPMDLVLQRTGRLHRHSRTRPEALSTPALYLRGVADWASAPPAPVRDSGAIYGKAALFRAAAVLQGRASVELPVDIPTLVRRAYDAELQPPAGWGEAWVAAEAQAAAQATRAVDRAATYLLDDPAKMAHLTGWLDVDVPDPERSEEQGSSQVRDSEDSLEVIALWRDAEGHLRLPDCAPAHGGAIIPEGLEWGSTGAEVSVARAMASCTLSLPLQLTHEGVIEKVIDELERGAEYSGWRGSRWIAGQLVLVFDQDNRVRLADSLLRYSTDEGLLVTKLEETP